MQMPNQENDRRARMSRGSAVWMKWAIREVAIGGSLAVLLLAGLGGPSFSQSQSPDNTALNKPGQTGDANRADQQSNATGDRELTRKIRKAIVEDKSLSTYAHNVKIITRGGMVTLKGPVKSEDEKKAIVSKATELAGASNVKDELTVKS